MQFADGFEHFTNSTHPNVLEDPDTGRTFYANVTTGESSRAPNLQECGIQAQCIEMNGMKRVGIWDGKTPWNEKIWNDSIKSNIL